MKRILLLTLFLSTHGMAGSFRWTLQGPDGGDASQFFVNPQTQEMWALASGLLYKNEGNAGVWKLQPIDSPVDFVTHLNFDPGQPQRLYVGTSQGRVLRSTDGGKTYKGEFLVPGASIGNVAVDPFSPTNVLATVAARGPGGVFRSTDSGKTWVRGGLQGLLTNLVRFDPDRQNHVYVTTGSADGGLVFLSENGGLDFTFLGTNGAESDPRRIDYGSTIERKNVFFAAVRSGVVKSVDGGRRWLQTGLTESTNGILRRDGLLLAATLRGLYISRDEGKTWDLRGSIERPIFIQRMNDLLLGQDNLYVASRRSGIVRSPDLGLSYFDYNKGFTAQFVQSLDVDPVRGHVLLGTAHGVSVYRRDGQDHLRRWAAVGEGLKLDIPDSLALLDPKNPNKFYAGVRNLSRFGAYRTEDRGKSWIDMGLNLPGLPLTMGIHPNQEGPDKLIIGTTSGTFQFRQELNAWVQLVPGLNGSPQTIAFDPEKPNRLFVGTTTTLLRSDNGGATSVDLTGPVRQVCRQAPQNLPELCAGADPNNVQIRVIDIEVDPNNSDRIFVSFFNGGVWTSTQGGANLKFFFAFLEGGTNRILEQVTAIAIRPGRPQDVFFGTIANGIFRLDGNQLKAFNEDLIFPRILGLAFDRREPMTLYARLSQAGIASYTFGPIQEVATFVPSPTLVWSALALGLACIALTQQKTRRASSAKKSNHFA